MKQVAVDGNSWEFEWKARKRNAASGDLEPATGLTVSAWFSATEGGAEIDVTVKIALAERSGEPGTYFGVCPGSAIKAKMANLAGRTAWEVFGDGSNVLASVERMVVAARRV